MATLTARDLRKVYLPGTERETAALDGVSFELESGLTHGLLGPNGAGKTTLLRILATIAPPTSGDCTLDGISLVDDPIAARRRMGFLSSGTGLYERMTARETLEYFGLLYGIPEADLPERSLGIARFLDFERLLDAKIESLSDGERQKVNFGRMMIHNPDVCLLDEPTENLDVMSERQILTLIRFLQRQRKLILFSTHDMALAARVCDRFLILSRGRIIASGTHDELSKATSRASLEEVFVALATGPDDGGDPS